MEENKVNQLPLKRSRPLKLLNYSAFLCIFLMYLGYKYHMNTCSVKSSAEVVRVTTDKPPAHCILKINSFSELEDVIGFGSNKDHHFKSTEFSVGGYSWVLSVSRSEGNKQEKEEDYLSVYVTLVDNLEPGSFVDAVLRFYLYDQLRDTYLSVLDVKERRFHALKDTWGVHKFIPTSTFNDPDNGYLVDDLCVFGAEVLVINNQLKISSMSIVEENDVRRYTWSIENFSTLNVGLYSPVFHFDEWSWKLNLFPRGEAEDGKYLSLFLQLDNSSGLTDGNKLYVEFILYLKNQRQGKDDYKLMRTWFYASSTDWGFPYFHSLSDLHDTSKGYLVDDTIIIEVRIQKMILLKDNMASV